MDILEDAREVGGLKVSILSCAVDVEAIILLDVFESWRPGKSLRDKIDILIGKEFRREMWLI